MKKILLLIVLTICTSSAWAAFQIPGIELIYTAPVEAGLDASDLRNPTDAWIETFHNAQKTIDFGEMYVVGKAGEPLDAVIAELEAAGKRGVKMRMLIEKKMLGASEPKTIQQLKNIPNMNLKIMEFAKLTGDGIIHAKYFIVDGKVAYIGSQNFDWRSLKHIHELGVLTTDKKIAKNAQAIFNQDWVAAAKLEKGQKVAQVNKENFDPAAKYSRPSEAYLVASPFAFNPKGVKSSEQEVVKIIGEAKNEILVQVLDYIPLSRDKKSFYSVFDNALRSAQARGVKIKLLVSHWNTAKPGIDHLKSFSLLPGVEVKIVTIPEAKEGFIPFARVNHTKMLVVDKQIAWVGTSNWSGGYMDKARNLEVIIPNEKFAIRVAELHAQLWNAPFSEKVDLAKDYPKVKKEQFINGFILI